MKIPEVYDLIAQLGIKLGVAPINNIDGCWEHRIDDQWEVAVNGHKIPVTCSDGATIDPFDAYIKYNGWPAGVVSPNGGCIAAGSGANEDALISALKASLRAKCMEES